VPQPQIPFDCHHPPGQHYGPHVDFERELPAGCTYGQRIKSIILYLNEDFTGGSTDFLRIEGLNVKPAAGALLFWDNAIIHRGRLAMNEATRHQSLPVLSGTKYAIVTWVREGRLPESKCAFDLPCRSEAPVAASRNPEHLPASLKFCSVLKMWFESWAVGQAKRKSQRPVAKPA